MFALVVTPVNGVKLPWIISIRPGGTRLYSSRQKMLVWLPKL